MMSGFRYAEDLVRRHPSLRSLVLFVDGVSADACVDASVAVNLAAARALLRRHDSESQIESVQQWRIAYRQSGTDPTKYRMAAESILRRLRASDEFTSTLHPLVVLCNSFSARFAVPVAALDVDCIEGRLTVGAASGQSVYQGFDGSMTTVPAGEVTFEDEAAQAHARKWSHKQSGLSAMSVRTSRAFIVAEAVHAGAEADLAELLAALGAAIRLHWPQADPSGRVLAAEALPTGVACPFASASVPQADALIESKP